MKNSMKDVMILSYEGNVSIVNAPRNVRKAKLIEVARKVLQEKTERVLTGLNNISYLVGSKRAKFIVDLMENDTEDGFIEVDYEDYI